MLEQTANKKVVTPYNKPFVALQNKLSRLLPRESLGLCRLHGLLRSRTGYRKTKLSVTIPSRQHCYSPLEPEPMLEGTVLPALNDGFLCVISLLSTFLRFLVTSAPRLSSAKTADTPPAAGAGAETGGGGGPGGGGGGGGGPPAAGAEDDDWNSLTDLPCRYIVRVGE